MKRRIIHSVWLIPIFRACPHRRSWCEICHREMTSINNDEKRWDKDKVMRWFISDAIKIKSWDFFLSMKITKIKDYEVCTNVSLLKRSELNSQTSSKFHATYTDFLQRKTWIELITLVGIHSFRALIICFETSLISRIIRGCLKSSLQAPLHKYYMHQENVSSIKCHIQTADVVEVFLHLL